MYVRDFESYKSHKKMPILLDILLQIFIFSVILAVIFSFFMPVKIVEQIEDSKPAYYIVQNNLFFMNFQIRRDDLVLVDNRKIEIKKLFFDQFIRLFSFNLLRQNNEYTVYKIIGLPNDIISIKEGYIYVNSTKYNFLPTSFYNKDMTFYLKSDQYFGISTYENSLDDSFIIGPIPFDFIIGKIIKQFNFTL